MTNRIEARHDESTCLVAIAKLADSLDHVTHDELAVLPFGDREIMATLGHFTIKEALGADFEFDSQGDIVQSVSQEAFDAILALNP